ncbi:MAG: NAD(P)H-dependent oxidoreductase [Candidatus Methylomirabilis sp.]|nr:NAD(P)H-dependent oxidoreductase [Deltaproteobacteria bacterium]
MPKLIALAGVLKKTSGIKRVLGLASEIARSEGARVETLDLADFDMPLFSEDFDFKGAPPPGAVALTEAFRGADGFILSAPEYNLSIPGPLKNAIDWLSTASPNPFLDKSGLLMSASPSMSGGNRGLWHLRVPLEYLGAHVYPQMFSLALSHQAYGEDGKLTDRKIADLLEITVRGFVRVTRAIASAKG